MKFIFNKSISKDEIAVTIVPTMGYHSVVETQQIKERFKKTQTVKTTKRTFIVHWLVWGFGINF